MYQEVRVMRFQFRTSELKQDKSTDVIQSDITAAAVEPRKPFGAKGLLSQNRVKSRVCVGGWVGGWVWVWVGVGVGGWVGWWVFPVWV